MPPRIAGSTTASIVTSRPARARSCCLSAATWSLWALARAVKALPVAPQLVFVDGVDRIDVGCDCVAVISGDAPEQADDLAELALAAVPGKDTEKIPRKRIKSEPRGERREGIAGLLAVDQRAVDQPGEVFRIEQCLVDRVEAAADGVGLPLVARKLEQGGRVAPC